MRYIPAAEFKAKCLAIMDEVEANGETIVITKRGKPVARLAPLEAPHEIQPNTSIFGFMKGKATIVGDIVQSLYTDEEWQEMEDQRVAILTQGEPA
jgi:prevent-host-death family protein